MNELSDTALDKQAVQTITMMKKFLQNIPLIGGLRQVRRWPLGETAK